MSVSSKELVTLAEAVVDQARRLGLIWTLRFATVVDGSDPAHVTAVFDGDSESANEILRDLISVCGTHGPGARVVVATVPPSGQYIIGTPTKRSVANVDEVVGWIASSANSSAIGTTPTAVLSETSEPLTIVNGLAYEITASGSHFSSAGGILDQLSFWLDAVTSGTNVFLGNHRTEGGASTGYFAQQIVNAVNDYHSAYFLASNSTSGTVTQLGTGTRASRWVRVRVAGLVEDYPGAGEI